MALRFTLLIAVLSFSAWWNSDVFAADPSGPTLQQHGWTITVDTNRHALTISHAVLGSLLHEVRLLTAEGGKFKEVTKWARVEITGDHIALKTVGSDAVWAFECQPKELRIRSSLPGGALSAKVTVSSGRRVARLLDRGGTPVTWEGTGEVEGSYGGQRTKNPSFLPRQNPDCMYFALGQVCGSVFHGLFDLSRDVGIEFPDTSRLTLDSVQPGGLDLLMPLSNPVTIRLKPDYYTKELGVPRYVPFDDSIFGRPPVVWCSWTSYYGDVTETAVVQNTDWLAQNLKPYGFQYVQIDDGYDRGAPGGHYWVEHWDTNRFPKGPEWLAGYIKSKGLHPGLWLVPNAYAGAVEEHPDWYLRDRQGKIVQDYGTPALDSSNPEVLNFLRTLFMRLKSWGFDYYKFDGEHALPKYAPPVDRTRLHDPTADPLKVYEHRLQVIRHTLGPETFIEGCPAGTPLNGIGYFNSYFNGQDVYNNWHGMYSLLNSINANSFFNHVLAYVMPGEGLELGARISVEETARRRTAEVIETARSREEPMVGFGVTTAEARTLVSLVSLTGVVYPLAGVMSELPAERLQLLRQTLPTMPIFPIDLFSRGGDTDWDTFKHASEDSYKHHYPEILDLKVNGNSGAYDVVALPNWTSQVKTKTVLLPEQLGLDRSQEYVAFDFWNQTCLGRVTDRIALEVQSHDTRVILLHPLRNHPQLIGNSRHISGLFSIEELAWDGQSQSLRGAVQAVPNQDYTLFFHLPGKKYHRPKCSVSARDHPLKFRQEHRDNVLSLTFTGESSPVRWAIQF